MGSSSVRYDASVYPARTCRRALQRRALQLAIWDGPRSGNRDAARLPASTSERTFADSPVVFDVLKRFVAGDFVKQLPVVCCSSRRDLDAVAQILVFDQRRSL